MFYQRELCYFTEIHSFFVTIRYTIKLWTNLIKILFAIEQWFIPQKWIKVHAKKFDFISERASGIGFKTRTPIKIDDFLSGHTPFSTLIHELYDKEKFVDC
jgi:hypothetical protein